MLMLRKTLLQTCNGGSIGLIFYKPYYKLYISKLLNQHFLIQGRRGSAKPRWWAFAIDPSLLCTYHNQRLFHSKNISKHSSTRPMQATISKPLGADISLIYNAVPTLFQGDGIRVKHDGSQVWKKGEFKEQASSLGCKHHLLFTALNWQQECFAHQPLCIAKVAVIKNERVTVWQRHARTVPDEQKPMKEINFHTTKHQILLNTVLSRQRDLVETLLKHRVNNKGYTLF